MELTPPLGYRGVTPLLREMRLRPASPLPDFALHHNSLPIAAGEAIVAGHDYPIAFIAISDKSFAPVIVLGVTPGENLFATAEGWSSGRYLPAYVRRYPYCMARVPAEGTVAPQPIICVEKDAIAADGQPLFDDQGQPTPEFAAMQELLGRFESELARTEELCRLFSDYRLFEPMLAQLRIGAANFELKGLYRIAEARLEQLMSNQLKNLIRKGGMALIYQHLSSMTRFQTLTLLKEAAMERAGELVSPAPPPSNGGH